MIFHTISQSVQQPWTPLIQQSVINILVALSGPFSEDNGNFTSILK